MTLQSDAHLALELCKGKWFTVHTTGILAKKEQTHVEKKQPRVTPNNSCQLPVGPLCTPMGSRGFSGARVSVSSSVLLPGCYNIYHTHGKSNFSPGPWDEIQQPWCVRATALQVCNQNENTEFQQPLRKEPLGQRALCQKSPRKSCSLKETTPLGFKIQSSASDLWRNSSGAL